MQAPVPRRADARVRADDRRARPPASSSTWSGRVVALERMRRADARDHPARRVRRPRRAGGSRRLRELDRGHARGRPLAAADAGDGARPARPRAAQSVGSLSDRGRAVRRRAVRAAGAPAGGARATTRCSRCCSSSATSTATRRPTSTCATSSWRCSSAATTARRPRWRGRSSGSPAIRPCRPGCARASRPTSTRSSRRCCESRPALTIAPRLLLEPAADRGPAGAGRRPGRRLPVARAAPRGPVAATPARSGPSGGSRARPPAEPDVVDPVRRRRAALRRSAVRRDGDARGAARRGRA